MASRLGIKKTEKEQDIKKGVALPGWTRIDSSPSVLVTKSGSTPRCSQKKVQDKPKEENFTHQAVPCAGNTRCFQAFKSRLHKHLEEQTLGVTI